MSEARLLAFHESSFEDSLKKEMTVLPQAPAKQLRLVTGDYILFVDFPVLEKYSELINKFGSGSRLRGIVLSVEPQLFSLSARVLEKKFSASVWKKTMPIQTNEAVVRFIHAWKHGGQDALIADFKVDPAGKFYLLDCNFKLHDGNLKDLEVFRSVRLEDMMAFELDRYGNHVYWPKLDLHLDLDAFKSALDPAFRKKQIARSLARVRDFGDRMRKLRMRKEVRQSDFAGISEKQIRRYESGEHPPTFKSLEIISQRLGMTVSEYLDAVNEL